VVPQPEQLGLDIEVIGLQPGDRFMHGAVAGFVRVDVVI
jgi:hypothetical protein